MILSGIWSSLFTALCYAIDFRISVLLPFSPLNRRDEDEFNRNFSSFLFSRPRFVYAPPSLCRHSLHSLRLHSIRAVRIPFLTLSRLFTPLACLFPFPSFLPNTRVFRFRKGWMEHSEAGGEREKESRDWYLGMPTIQQPSSTIHPKPSMQTSLSTLPLNESCLVSDSVSRNKRIVCREHLYTRRAKSVALRG